jgi:hypothetical protein
MPVQYRTVTEFLASLTPDRQAEVHALRELVLSAHPGLIENIKWNSPNYSLSGTDLLTVNVPRKGPVRVILHRGSRIVENKTAVPDFSGDPAGLLTWHSNIRASLSMPAPADLDRNPNPNPDQSPDQALRPYLDRDHARADILKVLRAWLAT